MKKKNWLMTIAFAVLALTIVSTCVIGSTYAKFTSQVSSSATAQAAGFLVTGATTDAASGVMIAPGEDQDVSITITYFSQVATDITVVNTNDTAHNTGVFTDTNWAALRAYYIAHKADIQTRYGIAAASESSATAVATTTAVADLITVDSAASSAALCAAIYEDDSAKFGSTYTSGTTLPAMIADATTSATGSIDVTVSWVSGKYGDSFDTFIGECIAKLAQAAASGSVNIMTIGTGEGSALSLTAAAANQKSLVATNIQVTAEQHVTVTP